MNKRTRTFTFGFLVVFITSFLVLHPSTFAFRDDEDSRSSLKGLKGVYVTVTLVTDAIKDLKKGGLSEEVIRADVELKLRMAGINVVSKEDSRNLPGLPQLMVNIGGIKTNIKEGTQDIGMAYTREILLLQTTYLERDQGIRVLADTWERRAIGLGYTDRGLVNQIRNGLKDDVDIFINAYLSVNPKQ